MSEDTRQRMVTATITVKPWTFKDKDQSNIAGNRRRDLADWLNLHWEDIANILGGLDELTIDTDVSIEEEATP